ncbi:MAG: hypothetical protein K9N21_03300 [Deltaproteobacteria bacterium]|nr:hypothetical protein [Deltaproteobacteria bacterium]
MRRLQILVYLVVGGFLFSFLIAPGAGAQSTETPSGRLTLSKVALFKSGVGYFELRGKAPAGKGIPLSFKREQMNDLLKSLTVLNLSGGSVGSIVYDSTKTAAQELNDYAFDFKKGDGLPQVVEQLQGSPIEIATGSSAVKGTVVGVEKRITLENKTEIPRFYLSIIDDNGQLRSFNTEEIVGIRFLDERLNQDLERYLAILFRKHRKDEKTLIITPTGEGMQDLLVGYVAEAPVWKATYRIVIQDEDKGAKPYLQGWAIVDNVSRTDWKDVDLSLVSGLPISFIQNLYDPQFKQRPVVQMEKEAPPAPVIPEAGMRADRMQMAAAPMAKAERNGVKPFAESREMGAASPEEWNLADQMRKLEADTVTREVGEMFEYRIDHPVTIERNRSALVPIVAKEIDGQAVDLYNEGVRPGNPLAAVRLKNSTGLTLEGGPLTVMQGDSYAGEALTKTLKPGEERYITYAVDLGLHVHTRTGTKTEEVDRVVINRGVVRMHRAVIETKTYTLDNKTPRSKTVVIEHPYHPDWKLLNKDKPAEITDNYIRFEVKAPGREITSFAVREMRDSWERIMVTNLTPDQIVLFAGKNYLSQQTRQQLEKIVALKSEISAIDRELKALEKGRDQIFKDQKRLRENLQGLGQTTEEKDLRSRYIKQLNQQETQLQKEREREKALEVQRETKQRALNGLINALEQDLSVQEQ